MMNEIRLVRPLGHVNRQQALTLNSIYDLKDFYRENPGVKDIIKRAMADLPINDYFKNSVLVNIDEYDIIGIKRRGITTDDIYVVHASGRELTGAEKREMNDVLFSAYDMRDEIYRIIREFERRFYNLEGNPMVSEPIYGNEGEIIGYRLVGGGRGGRNAEKKH